MDIYNQINFLRLTPFNRLNLLFVSPYNLRMTPKIKRDISQARKENEEADDFIREYVKDAEYFVRVEDIPF